MTIGALALRSGRARKNQSSSLRSSARKAPSPCRPAKSSASPRATRIAGRRRRWLTTAPPRLERGGDSHRLDADGHLADHPAGAGVDHVELVATLHADV